MEIQDEARDAWNSMGKEEKKEWLEQYLAKCDEATPGD
jgi:hypothetical protein